MAKEFALVRDWDVDQGAIPRFLNSFVTLFPDQTFELLTQRIDLSSAARAAGQSGLRTFGMVYGDVTFGQVPFEKRMDLAANVLRRALLPDAGKEISDLFWDVAGFDDGAFDLILRYSSDFSEAALTKLTAILDKAIPRLAFNKQSFVRELLSLFHGAARQQVVDTIAYQSYRHGGGAFAGDLMEMMAKQEQSFRESVDQLPEDSELDDLFRAMRRFY